jgi:hypothetical protein
MMHMEADRQSVPAGSFFIDFNEKPTSTELAITKQPSIMINRQHTYYAN